MTPFRGPDPSPETACAYTSPLFWLRPFFFYMIHIQAIGIMYQQAPHEKPVNISIICGGAGQSRGTSHGERRPPIPIIVSLNGPNIVTGHVENSVTGHV